MVLVGGTPTQSCTARVGDLAGKDIVTVEGLSPPGRAGALQQAILAEQAGQCGYCLSGIIVAATALLNANPTPSRDDVVAALDRNLCRCGVHNRVVRAVLRAARAPAQDPAQAAP